MKCPKCNGKLKSYASIDDGLIQWRYKKCSECGETFKSAELLFITLEEAGIADTETLKRRVLHIHKEKAFKRKISLSPAEVIYGKSQK